MTKVKVNDNGVEEAPRGDREKRWDDFVANYQVKNPVKFATKKANGEFDKIPASFK